jgi:glucose uptake protein
LILPATTATVLSLCILVFLALGSWVIPWRLGAPRLRFEIFAIDFAAGSFLLALVAAFTLGSMGSELAFTDSLLVSGHRAQALVLAAGLIAGIANVALIASASLGGIAPSFVMAGATGTLLFAWISGLRHPTHLALGTLLALGSVILAASVARLRRPARPARSKATPKAVDVAGPGITNVFLAAFSGLALAGAAELIRNGTSGELGVAPYAAFVFVCFTALFATVSVTFFLFNFPLEGARLHASAYFGTRVVQHAAGIVAGLIWAAGILGCFLVRSAPADENIARGFGVYSAFGSFVLTATWGLSLAAEPGRLRASRGMMAAATVVFAFAVYFLGYAVAN